jgi:hypothetical protein
VQGEQGLALRDLIAWFGVEFDACDWGDGVFLAGAAGS